MKSVCTPEPYFPVRRQPVCPELNELSSFWTVRNGLPTVPLLLSEPDGEATRSHDTAADADDGAAPNAAAIETRQMASVARRPAARRGEAEGHFLGLVVVIMRHGSAPTSTCQPKTGTLGQMTDGPPAPPAPLAAIVQSSLYDHPNSGGTTRTVRWNDTDGSDRVAAPHEPARHRS